MTDLQALSLDEKHARGLIKTHPIDRKPPSGFKVNSYLLACGYVEVSETKKKRRIELFQDGVFHVKIYATQEEKEFFLPNPLPRNAFDFPNWSSFDTLTEARNAFRKFKKQH